MNLDYKQNKSYGYELTDKKKMSSRERNVKERLALFKKTGIFPPADILEIGSHEGLFLSPENSKTNSKEAGFFLASLKFFLAFCVKILKRGDFIMVVARKK